MATGSEEVVVEEGDAVWLDAEPVEIDEGLVPPPSDPSPSLADAEPTMEADVEPKVRVTVPGPIEGTVTGIVICNAGLSTVPENV